MDLRTELFLEEYRSALPTLERLKDEVLKTLREALDKNQSP